MSKKNLLKLALVIPVFAGVFFISSMTVGSSTVSAASVQQDDVKAGVYIENDTFDFGTISKDGDKVSVTFVIQNKTDKAVNLVSVNSSCGCTTSEWTKEPIAPGAKTTLKAIFNPKGQFGTINKKVTAVLDDGTKLTMIIKGIVE